MPNHKSAIKRVRQNEKRRSRNRHVIASLRTAVKTTRAAIEAAEPEAIKAAFPKALRALNRAAAKGVIHQKQASRKIGRLTKAVNDALKG